MNDEQAHTRADLSMTWRRWHLGGLCRTLVLTWASALPAGFCKEHVLVSGFFGLAFFPVALMRVDVRADQDGVRAVLFPANRPTRTG